MKGSKPGSPCWPKQASFDARCSKFILRCVAAAALLACIGAVLTHRSRVSCKSSGGSAQAQSWHLHLLNVAQRAAAAEAVRGELAHTSGNAGTSLQHKQLQDVPLRSCEMQPGRWGCVPAGGQRFHIVIASVTGSLEEWLAWVRALGLGNADVFLYIRQLRSTALEAAPLHLPCGMRTHVRVLTPNKGLESAVYLAHILEHYTDLPHGLLFAHNHGGLSHHTQCGSFFRRSRAFYMGLQRQGPLRDPLFAEFAQQPATLSAGCQSGWPQHTGWVGCCATMLCGQADGFCPTDHDQICNQNSTLAGRPFPHHAYDPEVQNRAFVDAPLLPQQNPRSAMWLASSDAGIHRAVSRRHLSASQRHEAQAQAHQSETGRDTGIEGWQALAAWASDSSSSSSSSSSSEGSASGSTNRGSSLLTALVKIPKDDMDHGDDAVADDDGGAAFLACSNVFAKHGMHKLERYSDAPPMHKHKFWGCCNTFLTPAANILRRPRQFYQDFFDVLIRQDLKNKWTGRCMEFPLWDMLDANTTSARLLQLYMHVDDTLPELNGCPTIDFSTL